MKKLIFIASFAMFAFFANKADAQTSVGINSGWSIAHQVIENSIENPSKIRSGFTIGLTIEQQLSESFAIQTGVGYTKKGNEWANGTVDDKNSTLKYIDVPLLAKYYFPLGKMLKMYVAAGPYAGVLCGGETDYGRKSTPLAISIGNDAGDEYKRWDYGAEFAMGFEVKNFTVGLSYDLGLADVAGKDYTNNETIKNNVGKLTVGYRFTNLFKK